MTYRKLILQDGDITGIRHDIFHLNSLHHVPEGIW